MDTLSSTGYRAEAPRITAALAARIGDVGLAADAVQDAFVEAIEHWRDTPPPNPGGWLATTARRKAIDRLRRARAGQEKLALLAATETSSGPDTAKTPGRRTTNCSAWSSPAAIPRCRASRRSRSPCAPSAA